MRKNLIPLCLVTAALSAGLTARAQDNFEAGGLGVVSFYHNVTVTRPGQTGELGFKIGGGGGAFFGQSMTDRLGGELRYIYSANDLKVTAGGTEVDFGGHSHILHYDLLIYANPRSSRMRAYVAGGGGLKVYQGTGMEQVAQPLAGLVLLTHANQTSGVADVGGGVKFRMSDNTMLRFEFHDYISEVPKNLFAGANTSGVMHQLVPGVGFSWTF